MEKFPNVTQKLILKYKNKVIVMKHKKGNYDFPGGRLEWGEELHESLQRELKEELDYQLEYPPCLFHVWNYISQNKKRHSVMIYYIYELKEIYNFTSPENLEILWLTQEEMKKIISDHDFVNRMYNNAFDCYQGLELNAFRRRLWEHRRKAERGCE